MNTVSIGKVPGQGKTLSVGPGAPLLLIAGPCQIESLDHCLMIAEQVQKIADRLQINFVFKSSFDKANRTSASAERGLGLEAGLAVLAKVKQTLGLPVLTDVHSAEQVPAVAEVVDVLQIPAFLCRQTDLLLAAGKSGKAVQIKKGQFLPPADMAYCAEKVASQGNQNILLCERGTCFGYRDLIVDPRSLVIMPKLGYPVIFDATHSVQSMGGAGGSSGGSREYIEPLSLAATALGIHGLFIETHEQPERAPSDAACMLPLEQLEQLLSKVLRVRKALQ